MIVECRYLPLMLVALADDPHRATPGTPVDLADIGDAVLVWFRMGTVHYERKGMMGGSAFGGWCPQ